MPDDRRNHDHRTNHDDGGMRYAFPPYACERASTIGRPLGRPEWIAMLERRLGRPLAPRKPGQSREWSGTPRSKRSCCVKRRVNCHRNT
jgi:hypothetical protein